MIREFVTRRTTGALRAALRQVVAEARNTRLHRRGVRAVADLATADLRLHLGCGPKHKPGWVNVDLSPHAEVPLDLRERFPFADDSAAVVYSEHFFEHLDFPGPAEQFLRECRRVLQPGGQLRLSVPGVEWVLGRYVAGDADWFRYEQESGQRPPWVVTPLDSLNYLFRQDGEHRYAYDAPTLFDRLEAAGFVDIRLREYDDALDSPERRESLFVDATAPEKNSI